MLDSPNYQYPSGVAYSTADFGTVALMVGTDGEYVPKRLPPPPKFASINLSTAGVTTLVAAVPGKKIRVLSYLLSAQSANAAVNIQFRSGATVLGEIRELDGATVSYAGNLEGPAFETAVGEALDVNLSINKIVTGHLSYIEVE